MSICSNFSINNNDPVCYPGKINEDVFGCTNYSANRSIYGENNDGGNDDSNNGGSSKPIYKQTWFIVLISIILLLSVLIIIVIVFKGRK